VQSTKQEQIVGYFIEEAREHLDTLEKGLVNLQATVDDPEIINELFRAAHSVKGGAAMLGFDSIHKTAHYLEDSLKVLKDHAMPVDQKMESFFLRGFDALRDLTDCIQGPFGFREEDSHQIFAEVEPNFAQLQTYLKSLMGGSRSIPQPDDVQVLLPADFAVQVTDLLRQILTAFKQNASPDGRQKIFGLCDRMMHLAPDVSAWRVLLQMAQRAVADPKNSYQSLAPIVIKDLKQGSDNLQTQRLSAIQPSPNLQKLAEAAPDVNNQPQRISIPLEPQAAARVMVECFSKAQLKEIAQVILVALKS
jgi:chemotaxis protein histidine kinase CheA